MTCQISYILFLISLLSSVLSRNFSFQLHQVIICAATSLSIRHYQKRYSISNFVNELTNRFYMSTNKKKILSNQLETSNKHNCLWCIIGNRPPLTWQSYEFSAPLSLISINSFARPFLWKIWGTYYWIWQLKPFISVKSTSRSSRFIVEHNPTLLHQSVWQLLFSRGEKKQQLEVK